MGNDIYKVRLHVQLMDSLVKFVYSTEAIHFTRRLAFTIMLIYKIPGSGGAPHVNTHGAN